MMKYQDSSDSKESLKSSHSITGLQSVSINNMNCVHSPYRFSNDDMNTVVKTEQDGSMEVSAYHNNNNNNNTSNANYIMGSQDYHHMDKGSHMYMPLANALNDLP